MIMCSSVQACYLQPSNVLVTQTAVFILMLLDLYINTACIHHQDLLKTHIYLLVPICPPIYLVF